jgi:hypothetical protein
VRVPETLLSLGTPPGSALEVTVTVHETLAPGEPWFDTAITAAAYPFGGTLTATYTLTDLHAWGRALAALEDGVGRVVLGGDRAAELVVVAERQQGGTPDRRVLEVALVPSGDDPWPRLAWLLFDVEPGWAREAGARALALG